MPYNLINRKSGAIIVIDGKTWKLDHYISGWWLLRSKEGKKTLYIADISTGAVVWDKQILEYVLNRRLYKTTERYKSTKGIEKVAGPKDLAKAIRFLAGNIEKL